MVAQYDGRLVALTTETLSAADLPGVVSLSEVAPDDLQSRLRDALWQQDVPVLTSSPRFPPADRLTILLAGSLGHVTAAKTLPDHCTSTIISAFVTPDNRTQLCGYLGQTLNMLADKLNFKPEVIRKNGCGARATGSLDGRVSWLVAGRGDFGAGTCTVDVMRSAAVYMGEWFWSDAMSIGTAQPDHEHSDFLVFGVLTPRLWALSALYVLLFAASLRMFLGQGDDVTSSQPATRLLMIFIYMSTVTLMSIYAGNLTAFFSIGRYSAAIETLEELAASPLEPHITFGHSQYYVFENASSGARGRIWRKISAEFVSALVRGELAFFQSQRALLQRADDYLSRTGQPSAALCPVRIARQAVRRDFFSLMFPHHSQYSALFDRAIRRLRYQGVIQRIFGQVAANRCTRSAPLSHDVAPLDLHRLMGAFYFLLAGMGAALLALVAECCLARRRIRRHT
ncbi:glutamate receptor ionotropic, delta-2-like [Pollicipes pollicipes]|uniref:glutamate receptor ionotropic, delta-2-like n=1 Tax=Pollicipes pollicipes TaxID=41117 RepID=UPI001884DB54|nr:glutamate receptor ionotropic, delta-2-like [Pollicipes pollicipes]